ncbi:SRPBCC family protein [Glaciihabitans sp. dw_435]|uniref:SRPBCC family protein n=1 Tax=Glaciihabitans sp. dw_435 TaxID=2720081 RepID=UPI001BD46A16|nr:SRPBCC family protein [Glaciihabitans sp. dw_435]
MRAHPIYVETLIRADLDTVWRLTQEPTLHPRWDLRFSSITPQESLPSGGYRFLYKLRLPLHTIAGTGTSLGERDRPDGTRTSALRFTTADRLSPLGDGRGYWRYVPTPDGVRFITGYDYAPGWGSTIDRLVMRRFIGWMTAWSFERLRIWAETGVEPERWPVASVLAFWKPDRPRAARCQRTPRSGRAMDDAPTTLSALETP